MPFPPCSRGNDPAWRLSSYAVLLCRGLSSYAGSRPCGPVLLCLSSYAGPEIDVVAPGNRGLTKMRVIKIIDTPSIEIIDGICLSRRGLRVPVASFSCPGFLGDGIGLAVATR